MKCFYCVAANNSTTTIRVFSNLGYAKDYIVSNILFNEELPGDYDDIYERCDAEGWSHIALPMGIVEIWAEDEAECFRQAI